MTLSFDAEGRFTIVQFTDLHWSSGGADDQRTRALMHEVLEVEEPDLVVMTGDVFSGCEEVAEGWLEVTAPMVQRGLPWAAVPGNHDDESGCDRASFMSLQQRVPGCLAQAGPATLPGAGHFTLDVSSPGAEEGALTLYFLDSLAYAQDETFKGYAWFEQAQIEWFAARARERRHERAGRACPSLVFFHIPLPEYEEVRRGRRFAGECHEGVCCPKINTGFFSALRAAGGVMGVFVGHDHVNDFIGEHHGIYLGYGRATGYGSYGREGFPRGARVIRYREGARGFESWVRLATGARVQHLGAC